MRKKDEEEFLNEVKGEDGEDKKEGHEKTKEIMVKKKRRSRNKGRRKRRR